MKTMRWLLPFTYGVDMGAIDSLIHLAASTGATLIAVSLIVVPPERRSRGARLESIQQSKDFLEAVWWVAARYHVAVERHEVTTPDAVQQIKQLVYELQCDSIVLASRREKEILLHALELKHLLEDPPAPLLLIRLSTLEQHSFFERMAAHFQSLLHRLVKLQDDASAWHDVLAIEESVEIGTEEHLQG